MNHLTGLRMFAYGNLLAYRALFNWANPGGYVASKLLMPIFQVIFFVMLGIFATGHANALYFAVGNALQLTAVSGIYGVVMTIGNERNFGTLPLLLASPANRLTTFVGRSFVHMFDAMSSALISFAVAILLFRIDLGGANLPLFGLCIVLVSVTICGLGLMLGSVALIYRDVLTIGNVFYFLLLLLCGVNFPIDRLPAPIQVVSYALPLTRGVSAARMAIGGASLGQVLPLLAHELVIGAVYGGVGYAVFLWVEAQARKGGQLEAI